MKIFDFLLTFIYQLIALLFIYFFISGGPIFFDFSYGIIAAVISIIIGFFIPSKFKMYYFIIVPITIYILLKYVFFYEELIELGKLEWSDQGVQGAHRFINRIWRLVNTHIQAGKKTKNKK